MTTRLKKGKCTVLFFSDTHLRDVGSFPGFNRVDDNGLTRELNNIVSGFEFVAEKIRNVKPDLVVFPGDLYHTPEGLTTTVIHASDIALRMIKYACDEVGCPFIIMPGNHDCVNDKLGIYSVATLGGYGAVILQDDELEINGHKIAFVQFNSDKLSVYDKLIAAKKGGASLIVTHLDFKGAVYETGIESKSALPSKIGVPVVSGDIHLHQTIGDVIYVGSLVQNRFNRRDLTGVGGVLSFELHSGDWDFSPNWGSKHYAILDDESQLKHLPPERCVLQVRIPELSDSLLRKLEKYEYAHVPSFGKKGLDEGVPAMALGKSDLRSPVRVLKHYVSKNRPEAAFVVEEALRDNRNE